MNSRGQGTGAQEALAPYLGFGSTACWQSLVWARETAEPLWGSATFMPQGIREMRRGDRISWKRCHGKGSGGSAPRPATEERPAVTDH